MLKNAEGIRVILNAQQTSVVVNVRLVSLAQQRNNKMSLLAISKWMVGDGESEETRHGLRVGKGGVCNRLQQEGGPRKPRFHHQAPAVTGDR